MIDKKNTIFLLGGHDLEMITIREVLEKQGFKKDTHFFDKDLKWNTAKVSAYKDIIEAHTDKTIYGVELIEDDVLPENYVRIDHHNDFAYKKASILQVLELLDEKPTTDQLLIAANDVNHKEGMQCLCATDEEIERIRRQDRAVQGITKEEEDQAKEEIKDLTKEGKVWVIKSTLNSFTPIADFCDKRPLLVYSDTALVYFGDIALLKEKYAEEIRSKEAFHGKQYFGLVKEYIQSHTIETIKTSIVKLFNKVEKKDEIYSYHTFMLPFRFDKIIDSFTNTYDYYQDHAIAERITVNKQFKTLLESDGWEHKPFKIESNFDYNEYAYFYAYIRDTLYNKEEFTENDTSYFFEKPYEGGQYNIEIKDRTYELELEGLSLRIFETGIAIFSIEVSNRKFSQSKVDDILKINEYGRRIYAPFLGKWDDSANWTQAPKDSQLAECIEVVLPDKTVCSDTFYEDYLSVPDEIPISSYILQLLGTKTFSTSKTAKGQYLVQPIIDDRMFVLSWYGNDYFSHSLRCDQYVKNNKWYKYVFIDGDGITVHNSKMQEDLISKATYDRWMNYKEGTTLFGVSRYSFVALTNASDFNKNVLILPHMKTMYYQMFTLLLAIRASTLRFSEEVTALSNIKNEEDDHFSHKVSELYKYYIKFVNKIYFREITAQEQGIEIYEMASKVMNIERDVKDLDAEIAELHTYVSLKAEEKHVKQAEQRENRLEVISKLGAVFLPPSLIAGIYGMNVFEFNPSYSYFFIVIVLMCISAVVAYKMVSPKKESVENNDSKKEEKESKNGTMFGALFLFVVLILILAFTFGAKENGVQMVSVTNPIICKDIKPLKKESKE